MAGVFDYLLRALLAIKVRRAGAFFQNLCNSDQGLRIILIYSQYFESHVHHLFRIPRILIPAHHYLETWRRNHQPLFPSLQDLAYWPLPPDTPCTPLLSWSGSVAVLYLP